MSNMNINETLYYQWLINNNSSSTMLNAISGNTENSSLGSMSAISALSGLNNYGSVGDLSALGSLGNLSGLGSTDSVSSFSNILQSYLTNMSATSQTDATEAAQMTDKLSDVLEEAGKSEDKNSLTYQTVQEIYEYFSNKTSTKAAGLLKGFSGDNVSDSSVSSGVNTQKSAWTSYIEEMNEAAINGQEFDFSSIDEKIESAFAESTPLS